MSTENYCCEQLKDADLSHAVWVSYQDIPHIMTSEHYDDNDERELPIYYCPFCGAKL